MRPGARRALAGMSMNDCTAGICRRFGARGRPAGTRARPAAALRRPRPQGPFCPPAPEPPPSTILARPPLPPVETAGAYFCPVRPSSVRVRILRLARGRPGAGRSRRLDGPAWNRHWLLASQPAPARARAGSPAPRVLFHAQDLPAWLRTVVASYSGVDSLAPCTFRSAGSRASSASPAEESGSRDTRIRCSGWLRARARRGRRRGTVATAACASEARGAEPSPFPSRIDA